MALPATAQPLQVTVRDINAIPAENIEYLNSRSALLNSAEIEQNIFNDLVGETVEITVEFYLIRLILETLV